MVNINSFAYFAFLTLLGGKTFAAPTSPQEAFDALGNLKGFDDFKIKDILHFPLTRKKYAMKLLRHNATAPDKLKNQGQFYSLTVYVGSEKKAANVVFDTGSSDLWVKSEVYNPNNSVTAKDLNTPFEVEYGSGEIKGQFYKDDVSLSIAGKDFAHDLQLGIGEEGQGNEGFDGILGVGLSGEESTKDIYPNYPEVLANQGTIKKNAYSVYLGSADAPGGAVLFGGIDNAKHEGSLVKLPFSGSGENVNRSMVTLNNLDLGDNENKLHINEPVLLDTGTTYTMLPPLAAKEIESKFGSCSQTSGNVTFEFDGVSIDVPYSDIASEEDGECTVKVQSSSLSIPILGDNFLRHAYVLFDNKDKTASLAQARYTNSSDIHPIT